MCIGWIGGNGLAPNYTRYVACRGAIARQRKENHLERSRERLYVARQATEAAMKHHAYQPVKLFSL